MDAVFEKQQRRSIRLAGYDYAQAGGYFVTLCAQKRECLFGDLVDGEMRLNEYGTIVRQCWLDIPHHFPNAGLDAFVVMPNHVHGIIVLVESRVGARHAVPLQPNDAATPHPQTARFGKPLARSIPTIIRSFKSAVTKRINEHRGTPGAPVWQRNYYEHIIRNDESLNRIREYIATNPIRWDEDEENPNGKRQETK